MPHNERNCGTMAAALADREMPDPMVDTLEMFFCFGAVKAKARDLGKGIKENDLAEPQGGNTSYCEMLSGVECGVWVNGKDTAGELGE